MHNLLVTGNTGFIGGYLLEYFKNKYTCFGISKSTGTDISKYNNLEKLTFSPDIIIHAAASLGGELENCFNTNVVGTLNICKFAKKTKVDQLILISSIFIFDNPKNEYYNNYGMTKKQAEEIAESYCKENDINLTILRFSQIYDVFRKAQKSQKMLYAFIDNIINTKSITIYGNQNPIRNYLHIKDVFKVIEEVIDKKKFGKLNVVNNKSYSIEEIAYIIFELCNIKPNITYMKERKNIPSIYVPFENLYRLENEYISLIDGIRDIIEYEKR